VCVHAPTKCGAKVPFGTLGHYWHQTRGAWGVWKPTAPFAPRETAMPFSWNNSGQGKAELHHMFVQELVTRWISLDLLMIGTFLNRTLPFVRDKPRMPVSKWGWWFDRNISCRQVLIHCPHNRIENPQNEAMARSTGPTNGGSLPGKERPTFEWTNASYPRNFVNGMISFPFSGVGSNPIWAIQNTAVN
jgi:hypothetical protein